VKKSKKGICWVELVGRIWRVNSVSSVWKCESDCAGVGGGRAIASWGKADVIGLGISAVGVEAPELLVVETRLNAAISAAGV